MNFNILEEKHNPALKRKEIIIEMDFGRAATPSKADLQAVLAKDLKAEVEQVEITKIMTGFGMSRGKAWVKLWDEKKVQPYAKKAAPAEAPAAPAAAPAAEEKKG
ncbi:MAG: hypothetical protein QXU82_01790 [Candidatus Aenigmatarchaeota archaeon]